MCGRDELSAPAHGPDHHHHQRPVQAGTTSIYVLHIVPVAFEQACIVSSSSGFGSDIRLVMIMRFLGSISIGNVTNK